MNSATSNSAAGTAAAAASSSIATADIATTTPEQSIQSMQIRKDVVIQAPRDIVWETLLEEIGPAGQMPDGTPFPRTLEPWPGGRWFRDLGNNSGHLWGHVQVIKPPGLLEICGPLIMSYPALSHVQYRLTDEGGGRATRLAFNHRAIGLLLPEHREGLGKGWGPLLEAIRRKAEVRGAKGRD